MENNKFKFIIKYWIFLVFKELFRKKRKKKDNNGNSSNKEDDPLLNEIIKKQSIVYNKKAISQNFPLINYLSYYLEGKNYYESISENDKKLKEKIKKIRIIFQLKNLWIFYEIFSF